MKPMPLISVIVPVYKVEAYLDKCISSIVNQTYSNLEIILVDDGSPDNCGAICDAWSNKDNRIKVIHQKNAGSGVARNAALDYASGDLISFVDSDDYIAPNMYDHLYSLMINGADIAECDHIKVFRDDIIFNTEQVSVKSYTVEEALTEHIYDRVFRQLIWNKLYRRQVVEDIRFPEGTLIDDEFFTYRVLANARILVRSEQVCYAYRQQDASVMHRSFSLLRLQALEAKCQRLILLQNRFPRLVSPARINLFFTCLYLGQMSLLHLGEIDQKSAFEKLYTVTKAHPLSAADRKLLPPKQRLWVVFGSICFRLACRIRNLLGIGR